MPFPPDFLFGVATSAPQIEGAVKAGGRGESIWDRFARKPGAIKDRSVPDLACDHYHRYLDDIALMQELGVNTYRFSIAWPRVVPSGDGASNQPGIDFYDRLVDALLDAGITPFATLYHWDLPQALQEKDGWGSRATAYAFARYTDIITRALGDRVHYWITHNEPWCSVFLGHHAGIFAPGLRDFKLALQAGHNILLSHGLAVRVMRSNLTPDALVGIAPNYAPAYPATEAPQNVAAAQRFDGYFNRWFFDPVFGKGYPEDMLEHYGPAVPRISQGDFHTIATPIDFIGLNYYDPSFVRATDDDLGFESVVRSGLDRTADRQVYPTGMYDTLLRVTRDYNPTRIYITENGAAFRDAVEGGTIHDPGRVQFLKDHFAAADKALADGAPLKGYFVWSLMDNWEWASGYTLRYGITYTDFATQKRIMKDSARWYQAFIKRNRMLT